MTAKTYRCPKCGQGVAKKEMKSTPFYEGGEVTYSSSFTFDDKARPQRFH